MSLDSSRSAKSASVQGKRNFSNSISSNPSSNDGNSSGSRNKKKKMNQKTLGVAWGSNSLSSTRSSIRKSPFSDFGSYMAVKNRKLHDQFDAEASTSSGGGSVSDKPIFHGVSIFVDGFTVPSSQELRGYMLKHGGRFENYFSRRTVTHIICSNLPDSKIKNLRAFSRGLPVVKPPWILDSIAAKKLLSWVPYQLNQLGDNQPKLSTFFTLKSSKGAESCLTYALYQALADAEDSSNKIGISNDSQLSELCEPIEQSRQIMSESDCSLHEHTDAIGQEEPTNIREKSCDVEPSEASTNEIGDGNVRSEPSCSDLHPDASLTVGDRSLDDQNLEENPSSATTGPSNQYHSTLGDPNFVENYFKSSRLHFIGTWRSRYRKRFPSLPKGINVVNSNAHASFNSGKSVIIHIDMDCFFVSVVTRYHSELRGKPVAVCHSDSPKGTSEISSANYPARDYGVRAGMFVRDAKALCPHLVIVPYNFQAYEEVADQFYTILHKHCNKVQAVSCDEAFLDVTESEVEDPELLSSMIRKEIFDATGCTVSAGIGGNMLMARLATQTAKPDGQYYIPSKKVDAYLNQLPISALPGIGRVLEEKLKKRNVFNCGQLRLVTKESLQKDFGSKTGEMLWNHSRGIDNRLVGAIQESKSVGAEVNWGVRFRDLKECEHFLSKLCKEVSLRLQGCVVQGRTFTLKIKKRKKDAEEPAKYMGCGDCENFSHSVTVPLATDNSEVLQRITKRLFGYFQIDVKDIRGIGLQASRLETVDASRQGIDRNSLKSWLKSSAENTGERKNSKLSDDEMLHKGHDQSTTGALDQPSTEMNSNMSDGQNCLNQCLLPPPICHLDVGVLENLPQELFSELNEIYGGKLVDFIAKAKRTGENIDSLSNHSQKQVEAISEEHKFLPSEGVFSDKLQVEDKYPAEEPEALCSSGMGSYSNVACSLGHEKVDLIPSSLSQVDTSVLEQLPEELRNDILEQLPAHRRQEFPSNDALDSHTGNGQKALDIKTTENLSGSTETLSKNDLWAGNPPYWIDKFRASNCMMLKNLSEMYHKSRMPGTLSPILQYILSECRYPCDSDVDSWEETINIICELLKQYVNMKIATDIEEIYICFRLLKRLAAKSELFLQVYDIVSPFLQASVGENYGGNLLISLE